MEAVHRYGWKDVKSIAQHVGTRTPTQVRTHAQKLFLRQQKEQAGQMMPVKNGRADVGEARQERPEFSRPPLAAAPPLPPRRAPSPPRLAPRPRPPARRRRLTRSPAPAVQWSAPQITDQSGGMAAEAMSADQSLAALQEAGHMMQGMQQDALAQEAAAVSLPMGTAPEALPAVALEAAAPPPPEAVAQQM